MDTLSERDAAMRVFIYRRWLTSGRPPALQEIAAAFALQPSAAGESLQRLHERHLLLLHEDGRGMRIANPLSALPTDYRVLAAGHWLYATCAWDSLGIPAMLHADAQIEAIDALSRERVTYAVSGGALRADSAFVHFPLPLRRWYDDLVHT